jgi:hypothetical protein
MNASMTATDQPENVMLPQKFSRSTLSPIAAPFVTIPTRSFSSFFNRDHSDVEDDEVGPVFVKLPDMGWIKVNYTPFSSFPPQE